MKDWMPYLIFGGLVVLVILLMRRGQDQGESPMISVSQYARPSIATSGGGLMSNPFSGLL